MGATAGPGMHLLVVNLVVTPNEARFRAACAGLVLTPEEKEGPGSAPGPGVVILGCALVRCPSAHQHFCLSRLGFLAFPLTSRGRREFSALLF